MRIRTLMRIRKWMSLIGILSILSGLIVMAPIASGYTGADAPSWATAAVDEACERGLIDCELADPGFTKPVDRATGYQMLTKGYEVYSETAASPLTDVAGQWYEAAAHTAYTLSWTAGVDGKFLPANPFTRAQMSVAVAAVLGLEAGTAADLAGYTDAAKVPGWALGQMAALVNAKLIGQGGVKQLRPNDAVSKIETIVILNSSVTYAETEEVDVYEVAAAKLGVDVEVVQQALEEGKNVVDGELTDVEVVVAEEEEEVAEEEEEEEEEVAEEEEEEVVPPATPAGALTVALAADTPVSKTINPGANGVPLASFVFSVIEGDVTLDTVTFKRIGGGASTDFSAVSLYQGAKRLKAGKTVSADTNTVDFAGLNLVVKKDASVTLMLKGDVLNSTAIAASTHQFTIVDAAAVKSNAASVVGVPVVSNIMTIGGSAVGTIAIAPANTLSKPVLGQKAAEVANFRLTAGTNDVSFQGITLTHGGTLTRSNLKTLKLTDSADTTKVLAEVAAMDTDLLVFSLATSYTVPKNNNRTFRVWADVIGGKTTDTLDFYLDETTDLTAVDSTVGYGARVTNTMTKTGVTDTTFQGGKITLANNGPVAQNVAINTTNVHLFDFSLTSDRNVTIRDYYVWLQQTAFDATSSKQVAGTTTPPASGSGETKSGSITTAGVVAFQTDHNNMANLAQYDIVKITSGGVDYYVEISTTPAADTSTTNVAGTLKYPTTVAALVTFTGSDDMVEVFDHDLRTKVKNIKLIDTDTGGTIASTTNSSYLNVFSDDFDLTSGTTKNLAVLVDLDSSLVANNAFKGGVDFAEASTIKDPDANEFIATSDVVGGNTFGKSMTAVAASLTVDRASTPVSETLVKGQQGVNALGLSAKAGDGVDVTVTKVTLRLVADDDGTFQNSGYGDLAANTVVDRVYLYKVNSDGTETKIAGPVGLSLVGTIGAAAGYYKAEFSSMGYKMVKSSTEKWLVKVDLKNTISSTTYLGVDLIMNSSTANDVEAQDKDGNSVYAGKTDTTTPTIGPNNLASGNPTVLKTISTSGTLIGAQEGTPDSAVVVAGATGVTFAKYKFTATNEAFTITKLDVVGTTTSGTQFTSTPSYFTAGNNVIKVTLSYAKKDGTTETRSASLAQGKASFTDLNFYVPKDSSAAISILADMNTVDVGAVSGTSFRLGLNELATVTTNAFEAIGEGSSEKKDSTTVSTLTNSASVNAMVIRKSVPTVANFTASTNKLLNGQNTIAGITVAADAKDAVSLKRLAFEFNSSDMDINNLEVYRKVGSTGVESPITSSVSIRNRNGYNLKSSGTNLCIAGAGTTTTIYVTWDKTISSGKGTDEEIISAGATNTYIVKGNVANAAANESLSAYVADDTTRLGSTADSSNTAIGGIDELITLSGVSSGAVETSAASVNNTRVVWRWLFANTTYCPYALMSSGCAFIDRGGDGAYTVADDPLLALIIDLAPTAGHVGFSTGLSLVTGSILPGALRYTTVDVGGTAGTAGIYWDTGAAGGNYGQYTAGSNATLALSSSLAAVNNALVIDDIRYSTVLGEQVGSTGLYIDRGGADTYATASDYFVIGSSALGLTPWTDVSLVAAPTTAPTESTEMVTASANVIWSDKSDRSHATSTNDWTNGVDIPSLPTSSHSLSF